MTVIVYICHHCGQVDTTRTASLRHTGMTAHDNIERVELVQRQREATSSVETQWSSAWKR